MLIGSLNSHRDGGELRFIAPSLFRHISQRCAKSKGPAGRVILVSRPVEVLCRQDVTRQSESSVLRFVGALPLGIWHCKNKLYADEYTKNLKKGPTDVWHVTRNVLSNLGSCQYLRVVLANYYHAGD